MVLTKCCGCCSLQKGTIIVGFLYFISGAAAVLWLCVVLSNLFSLQVHDEVVNYINIGINMGMLSYAIVHLILTSLMIVGAFRRIVNYVFLFTCINFANIVINFAYFIFCVSIYALGSTQIYFLLVYAVCVGVGIVFQIYLWFVVYYFYQELITNKYREIFQHNTINYPQPMAPRM